MVPYRMGVEGLEDRHVDVLQSVASQEQVVRTNQDELSA